MRPADRGRRLIASIDALNLRERLAIFAAGIFVIGGLWEATIGAPLAARELAARESISAIEERLDLLNESVSMAVQGIDGGAGERASQLQQLRRSVEETEESLRVFTTDLVDPAQMRFVVEELLASHAGLTLVNAANLGARPVLEDEVADERQTGRGRPVVYRHGVRLVFEGTYAESLSYLEAIERLPWQLFWSALALETVDYPQIRIMLEVQTLSLDEEWIGV